jgi:hypothetical protein
VPKASEIAVHPQPKLKVPSSEILRYSGSMQGVAAKVMLTK